MSGTALWVTVSFPPRIDVASVRSAKLLKYLPEAGWRAVVVCPRNPGVVSPAGQGLLRELPPDVTVAPTLTDPFLRCLGRGEQNALARWTSYVLNNMLPPDGHIFWAVALIRVLGRIIERYEPSLIFTTCSPFSLNLVGIWARRRHGLPWVTDFRDLWTLNPIQRRVARGYHRRVSGFLEARSIARCDALVVTTEGSQRRMIEKYPKAAGKTHVVPNGFDPEDVERAEAPGLIPRSILFGGSIYAHAEYGPKPLLELLVALESDQPGSWQLHYAGAEGSFFTSLLRTMGPRFVGHDHGYLDHASYYSLMRRMVFVALCMPPDADSRSWIPARVYDYIGTGSWIICLARRHSEVAAFLEGYQRALVLHYEESLEARLARLRRFLAVPPSPSAAAEAFRRPFNRRTLALTLARIFDGVQSTAGVGAA